MTFKEQFGINLSSKTRDSQIISAGDVRVSVITPYLIRIEGGSNSFTDMPTQKVWYRDFAETKFTVNIIDGKLTVITEKCTFNIDVKNKTLHSVQLDGFGDCVEKGNLGGTTRTLDGTFGKVKLDSGILSRGGLAVVDDSNSLLLDENGKILPRKNIGRDKYYFAYGDNYRLAIQDFYKLTGNIPLLPRFCLGNWWSRYWKYAQQEYLDLMDKFDEKKIPLTVATVDMDWHWVDVVEKFGKEAATKNQQCDIKSYNAGIPGWTGYSWNTDLFPDYKAFLKNLQDRNLKVTLNLHPSSGVRFYEDQYEVMAKAMGIDPTTKKKVEFDVTDTKYMEAYFKYLHHDYEKDGVDFWWLDWQQGTKTKVKGLDPLWALNHYHYIDSSKNNKRGLILSRYADIGSHRYPLGFSGDTAVMWSVLKFQPYFTATASNAGYSWWSHDIGGHHMGYRDEELYLRWVQLGVFSPINRLHSTANLYMGKEPWRYSKGTEAIASDWLRFRKRLIPYIYSMNYKTHKDGTVLVEPMYYSHPKDEDAYKADNQFMFGESLMITPITEKINKTTLLAGVKVWLDGQKYTDIFNGNVYEQCGNVEMFRGVDTLPVLAKAGAIIPLDLDETSNGSENPKDLELLIFNGNGSFSLYEDDGETMNFENGAFAVREFAVTENKNVVNFNIPAYQGDISVVQPSVHYSLSFRSIKSAENIVINCPDDVTYEIKQGDNLTVELYNVKPIDEIKITISEFKEKFSEPKEQQSMSIISRYQGGNDMKSKKYAGNNPLTPSYCKKPLKELNYLTY